MAKVEIIHDGFRTVVDEKEAPEVIKEIKDNEGTVTSVKKEKYRDHGQQL